MPKFKVYQERDAIQHYVAVIEADDKAHARELAHDDQEWLDDGVTNLDDREFPIDRIEQVADDYEVPPKPKLTGADCEWIAGGLEMLISIAKDSGTLSDAEELLGAMGRFQAWYAANKETLDA